ncbi:MAG: DUF3379 domain-containing protein [Gammaproteobacteria bacterium]|nr:DUF3379 domain-containing protein [Gammaproteobacteria bacterium]
MDNSEFETRAFANPDDKDQNFLDAARDNVERQQLVEDVQSFNEQLTRITSGISPSADLQARLKAVAVDDQAETQLPPTDKVVSFPAQQRSPGRLLAMAAVLVLAIGVTYSSLFGGNQPSAQEMAFGQQVVNHEYMELEEIDSRPGANYQQVNQVFGAVGASLADQQALTSLGISLAKPCVIIPQNSSAHVVMDGSAGAVNIIMVNNSPVSQQFSFSDDRFETVVIPMENGNLILVGEKNETFNEVQRELDDSLTWVI